MKLPILVACSLLLIGSAIAFGPGGGGGDTSHNLTIYDDSGSCNSSTVIPMNTNPAGYTATSLTLTPSEKTLIQLIVGDSIATNAVPSAMTNANPTKNQMVNVYNGLNYVYQDPAIGVSIGQAGSYPGTIADAVIASGKFARVITFDVADGAHCSTDFSPTGNKGHRIRAACLYMRQFGWPVSGSGDSGNWKFAFLYAHGVNDINHGNATSIFTAAALATFQGLRDYGCTPDIFVAQITQLSGVTNSAYRTAQAALVDNPNRIYLGPDFDTLAKSDGTHLADAGRAGLATLWSSLMSSHY